MRFHTDTCKESASLPGQDANASLGKHPSQVEDGCMLGIAIEVLSVDYLSRFFPSIYLRIYLDTTVFNTACIYYLYLDISIIMHLLSLSIFLVFTIW